VGIAVYDTERVVLLVGEDICSSWSTTGDLAALDAGDAAITGDRAVLFVTLSTRLLPYVSTASDCVLRV